MQILVRSVSRGFVTNGRLSFSETSCRQAQHLAARHVPWEVWNLIGRRLVCNCTSTETLRRCFPSIRLRCLYLLCRPLQNLKTQSTSFCGSWLFCLGTFSVQGPFVERCFEVVSHSRVQPTCLRMRTPLRATRILLPISNFRLPTSDPFVNIPVL